MKKAILILYVMDTLVKLLFMALFVILACIGILHRSYAQIQADTNLNWVSDMFEPGANFYKIQAKAQALFDANPLLKTTKGSRFKEFVRWELFWQDRVDAFQSNKSGSFQYAGNAMQNLMSHPK